MKIKVVIAMFLVSSLAVAGHSDSRPMFTDGTNVYYKIADVTNSYSMFNLESMTNVASLATNTPSANNVLKFTTGDSYRWGSESGGGDFLADGSVPMTGDLNGGGQDITNFVTLSATTGSFSRVIASGTNDATHSTLLSGSMVVSGGVSIAKQLKVFSTKKVDTGVGGGALYVAGGVNINDGMASHRQPSTFEAGYFFDGSRSVLLVTTNYAIRAEGDVFVHNGDVEVDGTGTFADVVVLGNLNVSSNITALGTIEGDAVTENGTNILAAAVAAQATADAALPKTGGALSGSLVVTGNVTCVTNYITVLEFPNGSQVTELGATNFLFTAGTNSAYIGW